MPFRADQVGSLLRPAELKAAREAFYTNAITADALRATESGLIRRAVEMQENVGLHAITDGDFRRNSWSGDFLSKIHGVKLGGVHTGESETGTRQLAAPVGGVVQDWKPAGAKTVAKLQWPAGGIQRKDFEFLKSVTRETAKVTIPSPSMLHFRGGRDSIDEQAYPKMEDFFEDLVAVWAREIADLAQAGCKYLQLDDTNLAYLCDTRLRDWSRNLGEDPDHLLHLYAQLINRSIAARPEDMAISVHLCRGNSRSRGHAEGGYEPIAEVLFNEMAVDGFFLEYDDARSGDFQPLRFVPKGKKRVVLGIVSSKLGALERKDDLKRRIEEASRYVPMEQICISAQCGFSSNTAGNLLDEDQEQAKLALIVELADEVWGNA
jgi:5-methyltetrahydropteroyltriglutamate--homocysteine methyltransferase